MPIQGALYQHARHRYRDKAIVKFKVHKHLLLQNTQTGILWPCLKTNLLLAAKANFVGIRMIQPENHLENTASMKLNPIVFYFGNFETLQSKIHQTFALLWSLLKPFLGQSATVSLYFSPQACLDLTNMFHIPTLWIDPDCLAQRSHQGLKLIPSASLRFCSFIESQKIKPHKSSEQLPQKCVCLFFPLWVKRHKSLGRPLYGKCFMGTENENLNRMFVFMEDGKDWTLNTWWMFLRFF